MLDSAMEYAIILASILTIVFIKLRITPRKQPIFNVYQQPSSFYWLKVAFMYSVMKIRKFKGKPSGPTDEDLDKPQKLSFHEKAVDAVYFNAGNSQGDYLVTGTARRKNRLVDGFLFLKISASGLGVLETLQVPNTALYKTDDDAEDGYCAEGLKVAPVIPMKKWRITYAGKMKKTAAPEEHHDVQLDLEWTSDLPYFNFDTDMDPLAMAKNMALEPWSREYFQILQDSHQTHYEQFGNLKGTAVVDGTKYPINLDSCRDHSFGKKREWESFHRYGLHFITAENGDRFTVSKISVPIMFSSLTIGFVYVAKEKQMYPVQSCDLELYQHGEGGTPPTDYAFSFVAGDQRYTMQINIIASPFFYISKDWESKVVERLCTAEINGKKGWGISEWQYRNIAGRKIGQGKA